MTPKFIQIHYLAAWPGALLNRDDAGLSKRLPFGPATRTRVSSQCQKRHWRMADDPRALHQLALKEGVASERSKFAIEQMVTKDVRATRPKDIADAIELALLKAIYGDKAKLYDGTTASVRERQALFLGRPELEYLRGKAEEFAAEATDAKDARSLVDAWTKDRDVKGNLKQLRDQNALASGLEAALFGRMVTSDTRANTDAAIHVAHAFTVHEEQPELDYFTVVDDLPMVETDAGAAGIFDTELTSGLYYGYVVVDLPLLVSNLTGCKRTDWAGEHDRDLAARVVESLVHLIAEVSPGAKKGSTAPYSRAELLLVEAGDRQPRTLANAFRDPVSLDRELNESVGRRAADALHKHLSDMDTVYETGEARRHAALPDLALAGVTNGSLSELAAWAGDIVRTASVEGGAA